MPAVSVLMPVYNALPYLRAACDSVLAQTLTDFELIALDDASTDGSREYLAGLADPRVRLVPLPKQGYAANLNVGLGLCRAPLAARMDADDVAVPDRLAKQVAFLAQHPEVVACGCQAVTIDRDDRVTGELRYEPSDLPLRFKMLAATPMPHPGSMFRVAAVRAVGGYDPSLVPSEDHDLWARLSRAGRLANLPDVLLRYREHGNNVSATKHVEKVRHLRRSCVNHLLRCGYAESAAEAGRFLDAAIGRPAVVPRPAFTAYATVLSRFLREAEAAGRPEELARLRSLIRWELLDRAGRCPPLSRDCHRWVGLARRLDPDGMRWGRLAALAAGSVARSLRDRAFGRGATA